MTPMMNEITSPLLQERYYRIPHKSGLPVYVFPKKLTTTVAYFAVHYGSLDSAFVKDGKPTKTPLGVAHFLEHKLFENEDGSDAFEQFAELGADANAYTTYNRTAYLFSCTENFAPALSKLLDFVTHPHFTEESVAREQGIIAEEIREYEDNPWDRCFHDLLCAIYHRHPVRENICGTAHSIKSITPEVLLRCHERFYTPSNMALVVCGDVNAEEILRIVDEAGLPEKSAPAPLRADPKEPATVKKAYTERRMQVAKPLFCIGIKDNSVSPDPLVRFRHEMCMNLLCEILFSRAGEFYNTLFEEGLLTPNFSFGYSSAESFGMTCLSGEADEPKTVLSRLHGYLDAVQKSGLDEADFERCRRTLYADELRAYDSTDEIAGRLLAFALDGTELFDCPAVLQSITKTELEVLLPTVFDKALFSMSVVNPL